MGNTAFFEPKSWWKYDIYWLLKRSSFQLFGDGQYGFFFESRSWWKYDIYWLLKKSCFELFGGGKCGLFFSQEVDGKMIFTGYWEVLVLNILVMGNMVFYQSKRWWKDDIYMVFSSSPWYSRAWEIWFFEQWSELEDSEIKGCSELFNFRKLLSKEENYQQLYQKLNIYLHLDFYVHLNQQNWANI